MALSGNRPDCALLTRSNGLVTVLAAATRAKRRIGDRIRRGRARRAAGRPQRPKRRATEAGRQLQQRVHAGRRAGLPGCGCTRGRCWQLLQLHVCEHHNEDSIKVAARFVVVGQDGFSVGVCNEGAGTSLEGR